MYIHTFQLYTLGKTDSYAGDMNVFHKSVICVVECHHSMFNQRHSSKHDTLSTGYVKRVTKTVAGSIALYTKMSFLMLIIKHIIMLYKFL